VRRILPLLIEDRPQRAIAPFVAGGAWLIVAILLSTRATVIEMASVVALGRAGLVAPRLRLHRAVPIVSVRVASLASAAAKPAAATAVVMDTFRLRPRQRWQDLAPFVSSVEVSYDPGADGTKGVK